MLANTRLKVLSFVVFVLFSGAVTALHFQFPKVKFVGVFTKEDSVAPWILVQKGPDEANNLRRKVEKHCGILSINDDTSDLLPNHVSFRWEPHIRESYEVADAIFQEVARVTRERNCNIHQRSKIRECQVVLSFPSMAMPEHLVSLAGVFQSEKSKKMLGLEDASVELSPSSPAPYLRITFTSAIENFVEIRDERLSDADIPAHSARLATNHWVNNFLGKYRLCPYTSSITRAAVGLSSVGVPVGAVHVQVASSNTENARIWNYSQLKTAELVSAFWSEVVTLTNSTQEQWSTSLVVFPEFDSEFKIFVDICDNLLEPTILATQSQDLIGRAWFHPTYDADTVGHTEVIAGHAVPHKMVVGFMKSFHSTIEADEGLIDYEELKKSNNRVRQSPHATINILRRSQLTAAGEYESGLGKKKPKPNSIYVRNAIRLSKALRT